ncbi:RNB domain-containing ribonuclease [Georgenia subflava]|uniref:RNB domain-containing ribonuclease n=1 Tax=Georgenia subflava TaxID=1622177 RepID=A0A6N7EHG1_9MICO|nr:RNB domain-containing ribonuclease [Georgenia subflava]MPV36851.1 RNB domain-containing ribonuclease [Georgenia subflava]
MPTRQLTLDTAPPEQVRTALERLRVELEIEPDFPADVVAEAEAAARAPLPDVDATDIPFVTVDPPGSRDLDQALHIERDGDGYLVHYAIASVASFVEPGGAIDREAHRRGVTVYGPAGSFPLHPSALSAGAASLLEGEDRPACLWHLRLDATGEIRDARVERATVRSRAQLTYEQVQDAHDGGPRLPDGVPTDLPELLRAVGELRERLERERGGVSLEIPEQRAEQNDHGFILSYRANLPVEGWNAQISLLTGIAAAAIMRAAGVGVLRTLPEADPRDLERLRRTAAALNVPWPEGTTYGELLRTLDSTVPAHAAFLNEATTLFRGADYVALGVATPEDGRDQERAEPNTRHAAIAAEYAHVTAPLRRLVDRYGLEVCLAHCAGTEVPDWVLEALPGLPATMARTTQRANSYERGAVNALEALVLEGRVGETFDGVVVDLSDGSRRRRRDGESPAEGGPEVDSGTVTIREPAVRGRVEGLNLPVGERVDVTLAEVDVTERRVLFTLA